MARLELGGGVAHLVLEANVFHGPRHSAGAVSFLDVVSVGASTHHLRSSRDRIALDKSMPLPKYAAVAVCAFVLGAQVLISSPISPNRHGWYWPFLAYPMYAESHVASDSLIIPELRVAACGSETLVTTLTSESLGTPHNQLQELLIIAARTPASTAAKRAEAKISRAVEAQYPSRFCAASALLRVARVADTSTYHLGIPIRRAVTWPIDAGAAK